MDEKANELFYLWHLQRIGLLGQGGAFPEAWSGGLDEVRVAIIDSGCATSHPNLPAEAILPSLDVAVDEGGVVYQEGHRTSIAFAWAGIDVRMKELGIEDLPPEIQALVDEIKTSSPEFLPTEDPAHHFSAHGTASAGLIAGRTLKSGKSAFPDAILNYFGVNPFASIIPVATPYSHEIKPLIRALLHSVAMGADVILLPRMVNDVDSSNQSGDKSDLRRSRFTDPKSAKMQKLAKDKDTFETLLRLLSPMMPIVLAAGNDGLGTIAYPASLVNRKGFEDLIVVGSVNSNGRRSSYSSGRSSDGVAIFAPSDDEERIDRFGTWFDPSDAVGRQIKTLGWERTQAYSPFGVLAIDIPGRLDGEDRGDDVPPKLRDLYTVFGGTSAASAIVAGIASLVEAVGRKDKAERLTGKAFRELLGARAASANVSTTKTRAAATASAREETDEVPIVDVGDLLNRRRK